MRLNMKIIFPTTPQNNFWNPQKSTVEETEEPQYV